MNCYKPFYFMLLPISVFVSGCHATCRNTALTKISITNYNGVNDTLITIKKYAAGSGFTKLQDSITLSGKHLDTSSYSFMIGCEYVLTVYPIGKIHQLKNIENGTEKGPGGDVSPSEECHVSVSYKIDDSVVSFPVQHGFDSHGVVYIRN